DHQVDRVRDLDPPPLLLLPLEERLEVAPIDVLHDEEVRVVVRPRDVEDLDDVRVLEEQRQPRLVEEHRDELLVLRQVRQDALDRDRLLEPLHRLRHAAKHLGHTTMVESLGDRIAVAHPRPTNRTKEYAALQKPRAGAYSVGAVS